MDQENSDSNYYDYYEEESLMREESKVNLKGIMLYSRFFFIIFRLSD
jgi:hypothetical protein